jgi:intracellular multiplication protein IcmB
MSKVVRWVEDLITTVSRFAVSRDLPDYCDLETVIRLTDDDRVRHPQLKAPFIAVTDAGDYCTVYAVAGSFCDTDESAAVDAPYSWAGRLSRMTQNLTASYRRHGHKVSLVFESDPECGGEEVAARLAPQYRSIARTGIDMSQILDETQEKLAPWVSRERCYLVCYTGRQSLSSHELVDENKRLNALIVQSPPARFGQNPALAELTGLKIRHDSFLDVVERAMGDNGQGVMLERLDVHAAGRALREQVDRLGTSPVWQPLLPDDPITPHGIRNEEDHTPFLAPWLKFQLMNQDIETRGNKICVNGLWHGSLSVELAPQSPESFAKLKALVPREVPWRVRMDVMPGVWRRCGPRKTCWTSWHLCRHSNRYGPQSRP